MPPLVAPRWVDGAGNPQCHRETLSIRREDFVRNIARLEQDDSVSLWTQRRRYCATISRCRDVDARLVAVWGGRRSMLRRGCLGFRAVFGRMYIEIASVNLAPIFVIRKVYRRNLASVIHRRVVSSVHVLSICRSRGVKDFQFEHGSDLAKG